MSNEISSVDQKNAEFWNELCGTGLAKSLGITSISPVSLKIFDQAYLDYYPYLGQYILKNELQHKKVLEIGLGYGTLGQLLMATECNYYGLDIASNPVEMMRYRLEQSGKNGKEKIVVGSALNIPYPDSSFDYVYSIGCLHHTGNIKKAVSEVYRVLAPQGRAVIMLYNKNSFRQKITVPYRYTKQWIKGIIINRKYQNYEQFVRDCYDSNSDGESAPFTKYLSSYDVYNIFSEFSTVKIDIQNFDDILIFNRKLFLPNIGRIFGLDLYITAQKI